MLDEQRLINTLKTSFPSRGGIGDDAAILPFSRTQRYVVSKDILIENVHFRRSYFSPEDLAHKAIHVNLSDIAAMGGTPAYVFLAMAIPQSFEYDLDAFTHAVTRICQEHDVMLMGGDTTATSQGILMISVTIMGICPLKHLKRRRGARKGDILALAGNIGYAHIGLDSCERGRDESSFFEPFLLRPTARVHEGIWLGQQEAVTAMMDVSDGLWLDLKRLCAASQAVAALNLQDLARYQTHAFIQACRKTDPLHVQLTGGEDYSLLFTVKPQAWPNLSRAFEEKFGYGLKKIGHIFKQRPGYNDIILTDGERAVKSISFNIKPFTHFGEKI